MATVIVVLVLVGTYRMRATLGRWVVKLCRY